MVRLGDMRRHCARYDVTVTRLCIRDISRYYFSKEFTENAPGRVMACFVNSWSEQNPSFLVRHCRIVFDIVLNSTAIYRKSILCVCRKKNKGKTDTSWEIFTEDHFQSHFLVWIVLYWDSNLTEIYCQGSNYQLTVVGAENGLATNWQQAVI